MKVSITKREFMAGGLTFTVGSFLPYGSKPAFAAAEDDRIVAAAKPLGATDLRGMIWSNYYVPMQPAMEEFKKHTGIGVGSPTPRSSTARRRGGCPGVAPCAEGCRPL